MVRKENEIKVSSPPTTQGLHISSINTKQVIDATNNRAQYYADLAKKYRDEAKQHRDNAKYYSEQNSDVTVEHIDSVKAELIRKMDAQDTQLEVKLEQELAQRIPKDVSELNNDVPYVKKDDFDTVVKDLELPSQVDCGGKFLYTDGENTSWKEMPSSFNLFDTILKDHILTYEESKGLALQGTYVYKEAIAGSRYGYPDFYNKVVEEYNNSEVYYLPWTQPIATGETTAIDGGDMVITASSQSSTYQAYKAMDGVSSGTTATTGWGTSNTTAVQWWQVKFPYEIRITGLTGYQRYDTTPANANTIGQFYTSSEKTIPIGDEYSNAVGVNWNAVSVTGIPAEGIITDTIYFEKTGGGAYGGLGELKIEATYTTPLYKNANGHIFYNIADKDSIDEIFNKNGTAWFYGVDTENERVFLPRNNYFEQVTADSSEVGQSVEAGLPNITGWVNTEEGYVGGAFYIEGSRGGGCNNGSNQYNGVRFDASRSSEVYGNSDTVQPPAVKKLLYICVGNTESTSSVTDVVEVTTTENDTMPLFTGMYFDFTPNNVSWLKGGEQKNNEGIYRTCYNELVNVLNGETKYGDLKVINEADMIVGVDYSEYWKVNQDEMTFTTATAISNKALSGAVVGNGMTLGLTEGTNNYGLAHHVGADISRLQVYSSSYGSNVGVKNSGSVYNGELTFGVTTDPTKSGIIAEQSTAQLYFKVANSVQNLELLDVGEVMEAVADKISRQDCKAYITETYVNGNSWYRIYSDGWCEQGGTGIVGKTATEITLLKPYKDVNYSVITNTRDNNASGYQVCILSRTTTAFSWYYLNSGGTLATDWRACGYIA